VLPIPKEGWVIRGGLPEISASGPGDVDADLLDEDLLQALDQTGRLTLDAGWVPAGDVTGHFLCQAIFEDNWDEPIDELETQDHSEVIRWFENWMSRSEDVLGRDGEISNEAIISIFVPIIVMLPEPGLLSLPKPAIGPQFSNVTSNYYIKARGREEDLHAA